jgi:hypothetical protein
MTREQFVQLLPSLPIVLDERKRDALVEWARGCSCTQIGGLPPWECNECTDPLLRILNRLDP